MRFTAELVIEVDDEEVKHYKDVNLFLTFNEKAVKYSESGDKIKVISFKFGGSESGSDRSNWQAPTILPLALGSKHE